MKTLLVALALFISFFAGTQCLGLYLADNARDASAKKYEEQAVERDNKMAKLCSEGKGTVTYYKGVFCANNYKG